MTGQLVMMTGQLHQPPSGEVNWSSGERVGIHHVGFDILFAASARQSQVGTAKLLVKYHDSHVQP